MSSDPLTARKRVPWGFLAWAVPLAYVFWAPYQQRADWFEWTATTLTLYGKHHKTRTVEITKRLAGAIRERRRRNNSERLFLSRNGRPDKHLLRKLQNISKKAGATFHTELHKLRKTGASRRYLAGVPLPTLMLELGHESLGVTQDYLADVRKPGEAKKAVEDADFIPAPRVPEGARK